MHGRPVDPNIEYTYNREFKYKKKGSTVSCDQRTFTPNFTHEIDFRSRDYFTFFGPCVSHTGGLVANDAKGMASAIRRLTATREPGRPGYHAELIENQYTNLTIDRFRLHFDRLRARLISILSSVTEDTHVLRSKWAEATHPKRKLRLMARKQIYLERSENRGNMYKNFIIYKAKTFEILPPSKYLRAVADLTCPGSCTGGYYIDYVKQIFEKPYKYRNGRAVFVKAPKLSVLQEVFQQLDDPLEDVYFCYFSDDSCVSARCADGIFRSDCDISKSDGSQYLPVFNFLEQLISVDERFNDDVRSCFVQLTLAVKTHNPEEYLERIKYKSRVGPRLFSGSVLTTTVNNVANFLIFCNFMEKYNKSMTMQAVSTLFAASAEEIGYIVKLKCAQYIQELSFLKHFPIRNIKGQIEPTLCWGVVLRAMGKTSGDVPGSSKVPLEYRFKKFHSEFCRSLVNAGKSSLFTALKKHIISARGEATDDFKSEGSIIRHEVPNMEICLRYGLDECELDELIEMIGRASIYTKFRCKASDVILDQDYSYPASNL
jgi:hypothetical protein